MILVYLGRWSYGRFKDDNNIFYKMKNDLTTGTWQDDIWCHIIIILLCTSDVDSDNLDSYTDKHDDWNLVFAHHEEEEEVYPLTLPEIADAQRKDQELLEEEVPTSSASWSGTLTSLLNTPLRSRLRLP